VLLLSSVALFFYSRVILKTIKSAEGKENENNPTHVPGFSIIDNTLRYSDFQQRLIYCTRRLSFELFFTSWLGIASLFLFTTIVSDKTAVSSWISLQALMDLGLYISMTDIMFSTVISCCGAELWGGSDLQKAKKKFENRMTGAELVEASSSEDEEEYSNIFTFPVPALSIKTAGHMGGIKRMSIRR
jgi:hypothetical protein